MAKSKIKGEFPTYRKTQRVPAADDWYPNFDGGLVQVSQMPLRTTPVLHRVCVWGADDFGMEIDLADKSAATRLFNHLTSRAFIDKPSCELLGMVRA